MKKRLKIIIYTCLISLSYFSEPLSTVRANDSSYLFDLQSYETAFREIPDIYLPIYIRAGEQYGIKWNVLAAIHKIETNFGMNMATSSAGAIGHMQFMPETWIGWDYPLPNIPQSVLTNPYIIQEYNGYGVDANNDGIANPWDPEDAIFAAAKYLTANGASDGDYERAIYAYNHADWYVQEVLQTAERYAMLSPYLMYDSTTVSAIIGAGISWIGKGTYFFGGGRNNEDTANGIFDCSSFVYWCFLQGGIELGNQGNCSTNTLNQIGTKITLSEAIPGDLVFFDTYQTDGHVGIYIGDNKVLGCQSTGVGIIDLTSEYWEGVFSGHIRRL